MPLHPCHPIPHRRSMARVISVALVAKLLFLFLLALAPQVNAAEVEGDSVPLKYTFGFSYITGKYKDNLQSTKDEDSQIYFVPLSVSADLYPVTLKLTVPFLLIDGPSGVVYGNTGIGSTEDLVSWGIGQITVQASYLISPFHEAAPWFEVAAKLRTPTELPDALGSGQWSFSLQAETFKRFDRVSGFGTLGRTFYSGNLNDRLYASIGSSYRFTERLSGGIAYDWFESTSKFSKDIQEVVGFASVKASERWSIGPYATYGLSRSSADYAIGVSFGFRPADP